MWHEFTHPCCNVNSGLTASSLKLGHECIITFPCLTWMLLLIHGLIQILVKKKRATHVTKTNPTMCDWWHFVVMTLKNRNTCAFFTSYVLIHDHPWDLSTWESLKLSTFVLGILTDVKNAISASTLVQCTCSYVLHIMHCVIFLLFTLIRMNLKG